MSDANSATPVTATGQLLLHGRTHGGQITSCLGDAFAFIDPVFSSGVFFAMNSALLGAETVDGACAIRRAAQMRQDSTAVRRGLSSFSWFIYRMTSPTIRDLLMSPRNSSGFKKRCYLCSPGMSSGPVPCISGSSSSRRSTTPTRHARSAGPSARGAGANELCAEA